MAEYATHDAARAIEQTCSAARESDKHHPLFAYMIERENIRKRREGGMPAPWTDDPILQEGRFTNVRRSDDRTTRRLVDTFYKPNSDQSSPGDVLFNCGVARFFGRVETVLHLGWQTDWCADAAIARVGQLQQQGSQIFTSAYVITNNGQRGDKVEFVCRQVLAPLWRVRSRIAEEAMEPRYGWEYLCGQLRKLPALGGSGFMAKELAQDFMLATGWQPRDRDTFTPVGKGARRGLNRLAGRPVDHKIMSPSPAVERMFLGEVRTLFAQRASFLPKDFVELQLHDIQFCLCELDKYMRVAKGEGKLKRRYGNG